MPIIASAKKALRVSERKRVFNIRREHAQDAALRSIKKLLAAGKAAEAEKALPAFYRATDKMVKIKFMKKNTAARVKSRVTALVNKAKAAK